ncbi:darcynin family protein [Massilia sp. 9096]|uniref:darcynin family protein n=1 Tax=Massilia sp. 9096 TaxID=1500894 RepID=UPI00056D65A2|nr:darcynin family protein [Massilia sp. 9096]
MTQQSVNFNAKFTAFFLVKTSPEWLGFSFEERLAHARGTFQPILEEFSTGVKLNWYDTEFYTATITDIWMIEAKDHESYQLFCEKLRETPFWDRFFFIKEIFLGEKNAWAKNYDVAALTN